MFEAVAQIKNEAGIHCRPSALIVKHVEDYGGRIMVRGTNGESDLTSIMGLMMLALELGARVDIRVEGPGEERMGPELVALFETPFDFSPAD